MSRDHTLAAGFEHHRDHLRAVAFRMLGSLDAADDAVQRAWLRAQRADLRGVDNLAGWLTTVTARVCLDVLRSRRRRDERPLEEVPAGAATAVDRSLPEEETVLAESVGVALLVVLDRLSPAQRVAFVLHDLFAVPFDDIALVVGRSPLAAKKLASRARVRVRGASADAAPEPEGHRAVVDAFLAAARGGDLDALLELLAPDVVRRADRHALPTGTTTLRGARAVVEETRQFVARARVSAVALVDGAPGIVVAPGGRLFGVLRMTVVDGRVTEIDVVADPGAIDRMDLRVPGDPPRTCVPGLRAPGSL